MKVLFATEFYDRGSPASAFATRSRSIAREIAKRGHGVHVATPEGPSTEYHRGGVLVTAYGIQGVRGRLGMNVLTRAVGALLFSLQLLKIMKREGQDVMIATFQYPTLGLAAVASGRLRCRAVLYDVQDSWVYSAFSHPGRIRNRARRGLEGASARFATGVTTTTPAFGRLLSASHGIPLEKIRVVYNGADPVPLMQPHKDIDIIHLGSPRVYYDTLAFIDVLALVHRANQGPRTVFLGCTDEPYVQGVRHKVRELGLEDFVEFVPPVPQESVPTWLARSRIGLFTMALQPVFRSPIGLKVFEYFASGLPVFYVGSPDGETARLLRSTGAGTVTTTVKEAAHALEQLLARPSLLEQMANASRDQSATYTWANAGLSMIAALGLNHG